MVRALFILAVIVATASAFVAPANRAAVSSPAFVGREAPKVNMMENMADFSASSVAASSNMVASNISDFGGLAIPIVGLMSLAGLILFLAPPFADE